VSSFIFIGAAFYLSWRGPPILKWLNFYLSLLSILSCYLFYFIFLQYWGLNSGPTPQATPPAHFIDGFFKIGSWELFARAGFKPSSSWSLPLE
jgi:hypothetical protein